MDYVLSRRASIALLAAAAAVVVAPLVLPGVQGSFTGTDDVASQAIEASRPGYVRWSLPVWEPPSPEIESALFALQAAAGAGVIGYALGRRHGSRRRDDTDR